MLDTDSGTENTPTEKAPAAPRRQEPKQAPKLDDMDDDIPF